MSNEQLSVLRAALIEGSKTPPASLAEGRAKFDAMMGAFKVPGNVRTSVSTLNEVPIMNLEPQDASSGRRIIYLHGGGFAAGSAAGFSGMVGYLALHSNTQAVVVSYRKAPEHPYPAAIDDALLAYQGLIREGVQPADIVLVGDSAGATLALSLALRLRAEQQAMPAGLLLLCPWVDLSLQGESITSKAAEDVFLSHGLLAHSAEMFLGASAPPPTAPAVSPLFADLSELPPVCIHAASADILLDDALRLAQRLAHAGARVDLEVWPSMLHVWHAFAPVLDEGAAALRGAARFISQLARD